MWRLDLLEVHFHHTTPRYNNTTKLLKAKKINKLKIPVSKDDADKEIISLKTTAFTKKYHGCLKNIQKEVKKIIKTQIHKSETSNKPEDVTLLEFLKDETIIEQLVVSKLIKIIQQTILTSKQLKQNPPEYLPSDIVDILNNKGNPSNPSRFFINHCQNNKTINSYVSNLWNQKSLKPVIVQAEWSIKLVRGINQQEKNERKRALGKSVTGDDERDGEDEDDDDDSEDGEDDDEIKEEQDDLVIYDDMENQEEDQEEEHPELDPNINYTEITDEEPSEDEGEDERKELPQKDDFFEDPDSDSESESNEKKYNLPELTTGYYSGGSDDEDNYQIDDDKVVKQATSQRKNRRGQRARQKIWEQKFGKKANHKQKEIQTFESDRKRRQAEYEERVEKRQMKEKIQNAPSGSNLQPLGERNSNPIVESKTALGVDHPSWQAKKLADEKLKNVKFQGKKITFD